MDGTLMQIMRTLFEYSQTIDTLNVELAARGRRIDELEQERDAAKLAAVALLTEAVVGPATVAD